MRGRLLLLSGGGGSGPQTVSLPLVDDSTVLAPTLTGEGTIDLPLLEDGGTFPPVVFEDKTLELPLISAGDVFGPTASVVGTLDLPLIDDAQVFGPTASTATTISLPLISAGEAFAPSFVQAQTLDLRFIDAGWPFAPTVTSTAAVVSGVAAYIGGTLLDPVDPISFRETLDDIGSFVITLANDDPDLALADFDAVVRIEVDGQPAFQGIIRDKQIVHLAQGEEHDQVTTLTGPGFLGIGADDVIYPSRGVDSEPIEEVRSFSWVSPDFSSAGWPFAKKINPQRAYAFFEGGFIGSAGPVPHIWPDTEGWWIWADRADCTAYNAPAGTCLFRKGFTLADDERCRIFTAFDNFGRLYIDGAEVAEFHGFTEGQYVEIDLSAGSHVLAASVTNAGADGDYNPGGFICAVLTVGSTGLLDDLVVHTDATWRCLPYVDNPPGYTPGEVLWALRDETDIYDGVGFSFTGNLDAEGEPWDEYSEITVNVGRTYLEMQREMAGSLIDISAAPGASIIRAWRKGHRGRVRSAAITQTSNPETSDFLSLTHTGHRARFNKALIRYHGGWTEYRAEDAIDDYGERGGYLELGPVRSKTRAQRIANQVMDRRARPAYTTQAKILPSSNGPQPYRDFECGDTITCLDETDSAASMRVMGIRLEPDLDTGILEWTVELRDIELELEELHQNWLRRAADGHAIGGARVTAPAGSPTPSARSITVLDVAEFSTHAEGAAIPTGYGITRRVSKTGNVVEIGGTLTVAGSTATQFRVHYKPAGEAWQVLGTVTIPAGAEDAEIPIARIPVRANVDRMRPEVVSAGTGAEGLDIQVKAI